MLAMPRKQLEPSATRADARCENCNEVSTTFARYEAKFFPRNRAGRKEGSLTVCNRCMVCYEARKRAAADVKESTADKKLIVAGPGTGKSFMFGLLLQDISTDRPSLVFTLINNLVDELKRDVVKLENDQIKVNTLHGFCKEMLHKSIASEDLDSHFEYLPALPLLIEADANFVGEAFREDHFQRDLANIVGDSPALKFYFHQAAYYNAVSHSDSVYRVFCFYRANPAQIPSYEVVIVDEYQDFNLLEASFVHQLGTKSNIVIAGDDDQSLYSFRHASNKYIRELWKLDEFKKFRLPFCSRCTPVAVEAANSFIANVQKCGLLAGRIDHVFECYWPDKYPEDKSYPRLIVAHCSKLNTACQFVKQRIIELTEREGLDGDERDLQFLIIGPEAKYHVDAVEKCLAAELDMKRFEIEHTKRRESLTIKDGYGIIEANRNPNLGWRIVLSCDPLPEAELQNIITKAYHRDAPLEKLLPADYIAKHRKAIREKAEQSKEGHAEEPGKCVRIKLTNFYGSKGLSALHTIIIGLNNQIFPKDPRHLSDDEACKFIVALTRARRSCALVTNGEFDRSKEQLVNDQSDYLRLLPGRLKDSKKYGLKGGKLIER
jgi:hypothetical protein